MNKSDSRLQDRNILTRFTIVVLASTLFGMGCGAIIPVDLGTYCFLVGLAGFLCYGALELVARQKNRTRIEDLRLHAEQRLVQQYGPHERAYSSGTLVIRASSVA